MMRSVKEIWRDIPSKPGYQASNKGRIRSMDKIVQYKRKNYDHIYAYPKKGKVLSITEDGGYLKCHLGWIHRLVCEAFHGPCPDNCTEVNHINEHKQDNRPENLEWTNHSYNVTYGNGYIDRIVSNRLTWKLKRLKRLEMTYPGIIDKVKTFLKN